MKYTHYKDWDEYKTEFVKCFSPTESYVVCGAGEGFRTLTELFPEVHIQCCLDARAHDLRIKPWNIFSYEALTNEELKMQKFIITAGGDYYAEIKKSLLNYGVKIERICGLQEILYFWGAYGGGKIISPGCNVFLLTNCNLRCRNCSQFTPYIQKHRYNDIGSVEESLHSYFQIFDYVKDLILVGGETMLYRELGEICEYIGQNYPQKYHELKIFTNGLIIPSKDTLDQIAKAPRVRVMISDYTCSINESQNSLIAELRTRSIPYTLNNQFGQTAEEYMWFDFGDPNERKSGNTNFTKQKFEKCSLVCQNLVDGKVYYCVPACAAMMGSINILDDPGMYLDLSELKHLPLGEQVERIGKFSLGFLEKGYLGFCEFCNGFGAEVNPHFVRAGKQC